MGTTSGGLSASLRVTVPAVDGNRPTAEPVTVAYRDVAAAGSGSSSRPTAPVVLLHGSPGSGRVFDGLAEHLRGPRRLLVPDLPGFGASSPTVPDYSFAAHAVYLDALLDRLAVPRAHVVGFSMGGGVALSLVAHHESRVASLTLLSAIGAQEMELLGQYHVNHVVHGVQLAAVWGLVQLLPRRSSLTEAWSYARNFYDSDQRPLRGLLARVRQPTLIVHGSNDPLVPVEAAREHARLIPQAELHILDDDHFMAFTDPSRVAPILTAFLARVEAGTAVVRAGAHRQRVDASRQPFDARVIPRAQAVTAVVLAALMALGAAVFGGWGQVAAGVLVGQGRSSLALALGAVLAGAAATQWRRRSTTSAGRPMARLAWAVVATTFGVVASPVVLHQAGNRAAWTSVALTTLVLVPVGWLLRALSTRRRRRLLLSSWRRLTRWEYWPLWASYVPVFLYIGWLMVKHRGVTVFTAANPGIEAGGVVGESKFAILQGLGLDHASVAPSTLLPATLSTVEKGAAVRLFMDQRRLSLPVVLKPDAGQRGSGVVVVRTEAELARALAASVVDTVVQAFVPGEEFGVFYYRRPWEAHGHILSITKKFLPAVRGDGRRTLRELILDDERAVCMARFHLTQQRDRLDDVPARGQAVSLGDSGSHCRGALFLDGQVLATDALRHAIDGVAKGCPGFYFGRFDVRAPSATALAEGRDFVVLELNGVTSESTHIYDPAVSVADAYRALFTQWRLAFEIGAANIARGSRPTSIGDLVRLALRYRRQATHHLR